VWAVGMLAHESSALADLRNWRIGEGVEEVVFGQDKSPSDAFGIDILEGLEGLLEAPVGRGGKVSAREGQFRGC
jgi:hypothetical protein